METHHLLSALYPQLANKRRWHLGRISVWKECSLEGNVESQRTWCWRCYHQRRQARIWRHGFPTSEGRQVANQRDSAWIQLLTTNQFYLPMRSYFEGDGKDDFDEPCIKYIPHGNSKFGAVEIENVDHGEQGLLRYRLFVDGVERWQYLLTTPAVHWIYTEGDHCDRVGLHFPIHRWNIACEMNVSDREFDQGLALGQRVHYEANFKPEGYRVFARWNENMSKYTVHSIVKPESPDQIGAYWAKNIKRLARRYWTKMKEMFPFGVPGMSRVSFPVTLLPQLWIRAFLLVSIWQRHTMSGYYHSGLKDGYTVHSWSKVT